MRRLALSVLVLLIGAGALFYRQATLDPFAGDQVTDPPFTSLTYGVQGFLWWDETAASLQLEWTRLMVFSHFKQIFAWEDIEPARGVWDFSRADEIVAEAEAKGVKLVARLTEAPDWALVDQLAAQPDGEMPDWVVDSPPDNPADFGTYCGTLAARYRGRIAAWQLWNEANLAREWGGRVPNAAEFVQLLQACSVAIRVADPDAILISGGLSPTETWTEQATPDDMFFQQMYDAGFQRYVDVVGVHAPGYDQPPEVSPDEAVALGSRRAFTFRRVEDLRRIMVRNGDGARQMAILEMGWTTDPGTNPDYAWFAVDEATQADYFVRAFRYAADHWRPWMGLMSIIYLGNPEWTPAAEEYWWSVMTLDFARPAYFELANMQKDCGERIIPARAGDSPEALGLVEMLPCG
jgi:hypothetical protein